ncbi:MAG: DUF3800 domain-containing protein [Planctomycetota bacterium]|nr:DUF3800 domain-containing protein [Planctomycetota bacterium]
MRILFVDESGDTEPMRAGDLNAQPSLAVIGLCLDARRVEQITRRWVGLKQRFYPGLLPRSAKPWDWQTVEVKGTTLRKYLRSDRRREERTAVGFIDRTLDVLEEFDARLAVKVCMKGVGVPFDGRAVYTSAIQWHCERLQEHLSGVNDHGLVIVDSRSHLPNVNAAHSVFTQKLRASGDPYPSLIEVPVFGHSDNHAGLQIADVVASALVVPMCCHGLLYGKVISPHSNPAYAKIGERYFPRVERLLYPCPPGRTAPTAFVISNAVTRRGFEYLNGRYVGSGKRASPDGTPQASS